ncbi:hypothetical protein D0T51_05160 [Parabacteroides sp. 52]|uniref:hypothetical protein n=1 Tax=unclassified Parabacteroides TaxID=2649774 RepID=UPI0013D8CA28|nr:MULTISPECIES: hypothetical protein [unclassified Parabacteroides]MDH6534432.1 hypothetical protein [Parabacteroides sp. PM5-20]NDV55119.1 hypothetical protein [Parabacteroides sp. 52]
MRNTYKDIEDLLDRFFDGKTKKEEEQILYDFFATEAVPPHLESYKPVFGYFEKGITEEFKEKENLLDLPVHPSKKRWITWFSVAATVLFLLGFRSLFFSTSDTPDAWEGSYIIRNGERIDDLQQIRPELESAMQIALLQEEKSALFLQRMTEAEDPYEKIVQEIKTQYCEIIHQFPDKKIRKEAENILQIECE